MKQSNTSQATGIYQQTWQKIETGANNNNPSYLKDAMLFFTGGMAESKNKHRSARAKREVKK